MSPDSFKKYAAVFEIFFALPRARAVAIVNLTLFFRRYDGQLAITQSSGGWQPCAVHPGRVIFSGLTRRSNSSAETKPSRTASSFSVVPLECADLATFAALS